MTRQSPKVTKQTWYVVHYKFPTCFDDGGPFHDEYYCDSSKKIEARTDRQAQLASLSDEFRRKEYCYHERYGFPTKIVKHTHEESSDGWKRDTEKVIPLPRRGECQCGNRYWPIKGEKACHKLVSTR